MKLTAITLKKGSRYTLDVDDEYFFIVDIEIIERFGLHVGMDVDEDLLQSVRDGAEERKARERAYYLLSYRDHGQKELYDKLRRNVSDQVAAKTVAKMIEQGFLDDMRYGQKLAEHYLQVKKFPRRRALFEMTRKGIDRVLAEEILADYEIDPTEQIKQLIEQKHYRTLGMPNGDQKVIAALARQGFGYSDIKAVLSALKENEEDSWQYE